MITETDLREMSPGERRKLAHALAIMDYPHPMFGIYAARRRRLGAIVAMTACALLAGWIIVLVLTLHRAFHAHYWRFAWVGFDVVLLSAFAATGWAYWRGRQIVIGCLIVTGTLLCCDAWFDVVLDAGTPSVWPSVASALVIELPLALIVFNAARRLIRLSVMFAMSRSGDPDDHDGLPSQWQTPLFGSYPRDPRSPALTARGPARLFPVSSRRRRRYSRANRAGRFRRGRHLPRPNAQNSPGRSRRRRERPSRRPGGSQHSR